MWVIADWTTNGPYRSLSWLTIAFTLGVVVTLTLTIIELRDATKTYRAVNKDGGNEGMGVLVTSTLIRSIARMVIQILFLVLALTIVYFSVATDTEHLQWYRIIYVVSFLGAEALLCLSAVNDIVARHKLEEYIAKRREASSGTESGVEDWREST